MKDDSMPTSGSDSSLTASMISSDRLDPIRLQEFLRLLTSFEQRRIHLKDLWTLFNMAFPHRPRGAELRLWLNTALHEAARQGIIRLPVPNGRRWDRSLRPPVPVSVDKIELPKAPAEDAWRRFPWHPRLAWVPEMVRLPPDQLQFLRCVHDGLVAGSFKQLAPLKYRSLQLTGNEKRLGQLGRTALFGPGRITFELLGCAPDILPLVLEEIGAGKCAIVFENVGSFRVARSVLDTLSKSSYGFVGFGAGGGFESSILNFQWINRPIERIDYVGDLDRHGLRIARSAAKVAKAAGLPPVEPAENVHRAMIEAARSFGYPDGLEYREAERKDHPHDQVLVTWLPEDVHDDVLRILMLGRRVPEEILGTVEMTAIWREP